MPAPDDALEFDVEGGDALGAFNHPYAYAAAERACSVLTQRAAAAS